MALMEREEGEILPKICCGNGIALPGNCLRSWPEGSWSRASDGARVAAGAELMKARCVADTLINFMLIYF